MKLWHLAVGAVVVVLYLQAQQQATVSENLKTAVAALAKWWDVAPGQASGQKTEPAAGTPTGTG